MTDNQENKLSMYRSTETVLDNYNAKWSAIAPFATAKTAFSGKIAALLLARDQQLDIITGIAVDKKVLKTALIAIADNVAGSVIDFATVANNNELLNSVKLSHSKLERARDEVVGGLCRNIFTHASDNAAALVPYGITALLLTDFDTAINAYEAKVPEPRAAAADKKAITSAIRTLVKDTDSILKLRLDTLMVRFKTTETQFYTAYKNARIIINLGATHTKFRATVKDNNGTPIQSATVSLLQNNLVIYFSTSDDDGNIFITKIKPGTFTVRTEKENFVAKLETGVQFKAGKVVKRTVTLVAGATTIPNGIAVREGDLTPGMNAQVILSGINGTPATTATMEAENTTFRVYAAANVTDPVPPLFFDIVPGTPTIKGATQLALSIGLSDTKPLIMIQNIGPTPGHWQFTFDNLIP